MQTPAEAAERLGVRAEILPDLLELPNFAEALWESQQNPRITVANLIVLHKLPARSASSGNALDVERLYADAISQRLRRERLEDVGRRGDGSTRTPERVEGSGVMLGQMQKAQKQTQRLRQAMEQVDSLIADTTNGGMPAVTNLNAARKIAKEALR